MSAGRAPRLVYRVLGLLAVALAFAGVFLPGVPTTVFVLTAAYFFARSSPRLQSWLERHRWFGPPLRRFRETGGMTKSAKLAALGSMWTATLVSAALLSTKNGKAAAAVILAAGIGTVAILAGVRTVPAK